MNADAAEAIRHFVRSGFYTEDDIAEIVLEEMFEPGEVDEAWVEAKIRAEFDEKAREERSWPDVTDCDRLDEAFEDMNRSNIIAIQNAGYTQSDGIDDISEQYEDLGGESSSIEGYCFYHGQDLERAVAGQGLMLTFGDINGTDEKGVEIGKRIVAVLERHGFKVAWPGTISKRIEIPALVWQRRNLAGGDI